MSGLFEQASKGQTYLRLVLHGPPGCGKCLGKGTPILKYSGEIVPVEDVKIGDLLMGPDSKPREVLSTTVGTGSLVKINPVRGEPWICNDVHMLTLMNTEKRELVDIPVNEFLTKSNHFQVKCKQVQSYGVDFPEQNFEYKISPYFMGIWLGDGGKSLDYKNELRQITVSKPDEEIYEACLEEAEKFGLSVTINKSKSSCPTYILSKGNVGSKIKNSLLEEFRELMGEVAHIPDSYKFGSREVRSQVLAGLLDTDGYYSHGGFEIAQKNARLAEDISFVTRSLGLRINKSIKYVNEVPYVRLYISGDCSFLPLRIERKKAQPRKQIKDNNLTGISIESVGEGEYFGFTLDGDGRFLLGDFTITHNSWTSLKLSHYLEKLYGYPENSIVALDSERGSLSKYAGEVYNEEGDKFKFLTVGDKFLQGDYNPKKVITIIKEAEKSEKKILIIDSLSHFWEGSGGMLDLIEQESKKLKGNSYAAWKTGDPIYRDLVQSLTTARCHVIVTLRAKMAYEQKTNEQTQRKEIQRLGMAPIIRDHFVSEMDVEGILDDTHTLFVGKTRCNAVDGKVYAKPGAEFAKALHDWNSSGENRRDVFSELKQALEQVKSKEELDKVATDIKQNKLFISTFELEELQTLYKNIKLT